MSEVLHAGAVVPAAVGLCCVARDRARVPEMVDPLPMLGNVNAAAAALRNWVLNLNKELAGSGVHAGHVAISVWIGDGGPAGIPSAQPDQIAPLYWEMHEARDRLRPTSPPDRPSREAAPAALSSR